MRQAIEGTARNFYGLEGRNEQRFDRVQPIELDDCYIVNRGDAIVYEAGFAFPADNHFRPQIIQIASGLLCLATSVADGNSLRAALDALPWQSLAVALPQWKERHGDWLIAEIEAKPRKGFVIAGYQREAKPRGIWLRGFPSDGLLKRNRLIDTDHVLTTRMALDHRGRLYLRAANIEAIPSFFDDLALKRVATHVPAQPTAGAQTMVFGFALDLVKIYQAVLKNGFNFFTYFYGADMARRPEFDTLRKMLMDVPVDRKLMMQHCQMYEASPNDFPKSGNPFEHRLQLELNAEGVVRFRMRLFDSLGYEALLGRLPGPLLPSFRTKRALVDFLGVGIREVDCWPRE